MINWVVQIKLYLDYKTTECVYYLRQLLCTCVEFPSNISFNYSLRDNYSLKKVSPSFLII